MRNAIKRAISAIETKPDDINDILRETLQIIDKTAAKGIIKKKTAARKKSRLAKAFNKGGFEAANTPAKKAKKTSTSKPKAAAAKKETPATKKAPAKKPAAKTTTAKPKATTKKAAPAKKAASDKK